MLLAILLAVASYLWGSVSVGYILLRRHEVPLKKIRRGGLGATNVSRYLGGRYFAVVLLLDTFKTYAPTALVLYTTHDRVLACVVGFAAVIGHCASFWLRYASALRDWKGGKAVSSALGVVIALQPWLALTCIAIWIIGYLLAGFRVSVGSLLAALGLALLQAHGETSSFVRFTMYGIAAYLWIKHAPNLKRLLSGKEPATKFWLKSNSESIQFVAFLVHLMSDDPQVTMNILADKIFLLRPFRHWDWLVRTIHNKVIRKIPQSWLVFGKGTLITPPNGKKVEFVLIVVPLDPSTMLAKPTAHCRPMDYVRRAAWQGVRLGADEIGLGALNTGVGENGYGDIGYGHEVAQYVNPFGVAVNTGNAYTVATSLQGVVVILNLMRLDPKASTLTIIGARGSIGRALARRAVGQFATVRVAGRNLEEMKEFCQQSSLDCIPYGGEDRYYAACKGAHAILLVTSSPTPLDLDFAGIDPGTVVCDVARPRATGGELARMRPDVLVTDGPLVRFPGLSRVFPMTGFKAGVGFPCMAQCAMHASLGLSGNMSCEKELNETEVDQVTEWAAMLRFPLADLRRSDKPVNDAEIREFAHKYVKGQGVSKV